MADRTAQDRERLRAVDTVWLDADDAGPPIAIGGVLVVAGPAPSPEEIRSLVADRLDRMPRLRQRVRHSQARLKRPTWETVDDLDLAHHVRERAVLAPGDADALDRTVTELMAVPLDRDRPLWDVHVVTGLADDRWAMVARMHHAVADGQGAVLLMGQLVDTDPEGGATLTAALDALMAEAVRRHRERSAERPGGREQLAEAAAKGGDLVLRALRKGLAPEDLAAARGAVRDAATAGAASVAKAREALATVRADTPGSLAGPPGTERTWRSCSVPLADVKEIRGALGGTVNDVVMTLMSGGFRRVLQARGEELRTVRVLVPVSVRTPGDLSANNQVSGLIVMLPTTADEATRLAEVRRHIGVLKDVGAVGVGKVLFDLNQAVPAAAQTLVVRTLDQLPATVVETLVTNVPGPQFPVYVAGRRVVSMTPVIPLGGFLTVSTGILSYDGELRLGISGGSGAADAVTDLRDGIVEALAGLLAAARARTAATPGPGAGA